MSIVKLVRVSKIYGKDSKAVHDISLEVRDKEFLVLVGPSGCGKSTILRMIAGLEDITDGTLYIDNKKMNNILPKERNIAMVFQNYALYPHMTVFENMAFGLKLRKIPKNKIREQVYNAADILGLTSYLHRKPSKLSGGQRQRVALGRAIVRNPSVFLFDEPLSNLDAKLRMQMRREISKLHVRLQATMIYVTHDQTEAMTMGNRIAVLKNGVLQQLDEPVRLYNNPANKFVAGFIGSPAMNFIKGTILRKNNELFFVSPSFHISINALHNIRLSTYIGKSVILGVRPEYIKLNTPDNEASGQTVIDMIEPLGAETFLYLQTSEGQLICREQNDFSYLSGQKVSISFETDHLHFFDAFTENSI